jgi:hypothetical protein
VDVDRVSDEVLAEAISAMLDILREGYPRGLPCMGAAKVLEKDFQIPRDQYEVIEETLIEKQWIEKRDGMLYYYHSHKMS